jgi:CheY-like chemotaxis protein/anti-sigma regulatory factor (Ser/Thr protein kinase)
MKMKVKDEPIAADLEKIESLALEGAKTVKRIQEYSVGAKYKNLEPVDLCQIVENCFIPNRASWQQMADTRRVTVKRKTELAEAFVDGSLEDLETALTKLLENAVEHSPTDSEVLVTIESDDNGWILAVQDHGAGISEEIKKKVFYPFFSTKESPRAGLSLATVHGIVVRHGGKIDFESSPQDGTTFRIFLRRPDVYDEISEITNRNKGDRELAILVVDDDEQIREILADMLAMDGHEAVTCADGPSALQTLEHREFDLMITDLGMPGMSGLELSGEAHRQHPELPIAMITGWGTQLNEDEISHKGIKTILAKPFHLKDVKSLINDLVQH